MLLLIYLQACVCLCVFSYMFDGEVLLDQTVPAVSENGNRRFRDFQSENKGHRDCFFLPLKS